MSGMTRAAALGVPARVLHPLAHDFAPDLLTLQESPPARRPRAVLLAVVLVTGALLAWANWARVDVVASAQGRLVPQTFTKIVQPAEAGIVNEVRVREGQTVRAGDVLLRLDPRLSSTDVRAQQQEVALKRMSLQRIAAELADQPLVLAAAEGGHAQLSAQVLTQFDARRQALTDALAQEQQALLRIQADLAGAEQVQRKLQQTLPLLEQAAQAYDKLLKDGFVGEVAANEKKRDWVEKAQDLKAQDEAVRSLRAQIAQSQARLAGIRSQYRSQLENERIDTQAQLTRSVQELDKSRIRAMSLEIRAPADGVVKDLAVSGAGAVVQAGALLMNLVPAHEPVQAEVLLANEDVGFVAPGQVVQLKVAAYPFQKYGLVQGRVAVLSADAQDARQQAQMASPGTNLTAMVNGNQTYRALITLEHQALRTPSGEVLKLSPGMLVTADVHQGERTVLEYLLSPVQKLGAEAGRER